jgi:hypothetical protein
MLIWAAGSASAGVANRPAAAARNMIFFMGLVLV